MSIEELLRALEWLKVETGSLACLGCECENNCGMHGCRIIREAISCIRGERRGKDEEMITRSEVVKLLLEEIDRCRRAPDLNGCEMREEWQKTIDVCSIAVSAIREQEERENPKPLTMEELRQMDAPVWCLCKPIEGGNGFWCLCKKGKIITPSGVCYDVKEIQHWVLLRNKPKEDAK